MIRDAFWKKHSKSKIQFDDTNSSYSQSSNSTNVICIIPDLWNTLKKLPRSWSMYAMEMFICHGQSMGIKDSKGIGRPCCILTLCEWAGVSSLRLMMSLPWSLFTGNIGFLFFVFVLRCSLSRGAVGSELGRKTSPARWEVWVGSTIERQKPETWKVSDSVESRVLQRAVPGTGMWVWGGSPHMLSGPETWI